jgi:hypothetical protein
MTQSLNQLWKKSGKLKPFKEFAEEYNKKKYSANGGSPIIEEVYFEQPTVPTLDTSIMDDNIAYENADYEVEGETASVSNTIDPKEIAMYAGVGLIIGVALVLLTTSNNK